MRHAITALLVATLAGCSTLPAVDDGDCQLRAGAALGEGQAAMFGGGNLTGGAVTLINPGRCDVRKLRVFTRYGSTLVCMGSEDWCSLALEARPVELTAEQLRELTLGRGAERMIGMLIRWVLTGALIWMVYGEAGPFTALAFALVAIALELRAMSLQ